MLRSVADSVPHGRVGKEEGVEAVDGGELHDDEPRIALFMLCSLLPCMSCNLSIVSFVTKTCLFRKL